MSTRHGQRSTLSRPTALSSSSSSSSSYYHHRGQQHYRHHESHSPRSSVIDDSATSSSSSSSSSTLGSELTRLIQKERSVVDFRNAFFPGRNGATECHRFLYGLLRGRCLVFHAHHYAVQQMWLDRVREYRIPTLSSTASPSSADAAFKVYYTQIIDDPVTRLSATGHQHYYAVLAVKALCSLLSGYPERALNSLFEMPRALLQAIMSGGSPQLTAHFRDHWLCAQCYEKVLLDSTSVMLSDTVLLDLLFHDEFVMTSESPSARINNAEHRSLLRVQTDREARQKLMVTIEQQRNSTAVPYELGGSGSGGGGGARDERLPRCPEEIPTEHVNRYIAHDWTRQIQLRAERTPTTEVMPSDYYVLCAYVLFVIEAMRFHANAEHYAARADKRYSGSPSSSSSSAAAPPRQQLTVGELLTLFPVCMAVIRDENIDYVDSVLDKCEEASPGVCEHLIQHVAVTVRHFMINPSVGSTDLCPPSPATVLMLNIRTCVAPMLRRFDDLRRVLQTTLSVGSGSFDAIASTARSLGGKSSSSSSISSHYRQQRARFHRVDHTSLDVLLFDVLLERTTDVNSFNSLAVWMHKVASGPAGVVLTPLDLNDHQALRARAELLNNHYVAVCFFAVNTHSSVDSYLAPSVDVDLFSLMGTLEALAARYPELNLHALHVRHLGYSVSLGSFMVIHKDVLWMLRHAMLNSVLTGEGRSFVKNTPVYPLLVSTYVARMASTPGLASLIANHDHRALFLPYDSLDAAPRQPLGSDPNVFALRCFVDTLSEWLDVPSVMLESNTPWRLGVPTPTSQHFGAMRFLHRLVDQLQLGHQASVVVGDSDAARDLFDVSSFLDTNDDALNAVRSFLQLRLPHSISHDLYETLCQLYPLPPSATASSTDNDDSDNSYEDARQRQPHHAIDLAYLLHALRPVADAALEASKGASGGDNHAFCNEVLRHVDTLHSRANMSEPVSSTRKRARADSTLASSASASSNSKSTRYSSSTVVFERGTAARPSCRVPILCTAEVIARLPPTHPVRALTDKHDRLAHANLLFYSAPLVDALELTLSYQLLCDMRAACRRVDSAALFAERRYAGSIDEAMSNFRYVKSHYESNILKPRSVGGANSVLLAYTPVEPMDAFSRLLMRLDYRLTCGRAASTSPLATMAVADVLSSKQQCRDLSAATAAASSADEAHVSAKPAIDTSKSLGEVDIHTALPVQIDLSPSDHTRDIYYAENSLLLFTSIAYSECQASLSAGARAALEMATAMTSYQNMAEYAAELRRQYMTALSSGDSSAASAYVSGRWFKRRSDVIRQRRQAAEKEIRRRENLINSCGVSLDAFMTAMETE